MGRSGFDSVMASCDGVAGGNAACEALPSYLLRLYSQRACPSRHLFQRLTHGLPGSICKIQTVRMRLFDISTPAVIVLGLSAVASAAVIATIWRKRDPPFLKCATTLVALTPVVGPLVAWWVVSFPEPMHPDLQAKGKRTVNEYSVPREFIREKVRRDRGGDEA